MGLTEDSIQAHSRSPPVPAWTTLPLFFFFTGLSKLLWIQFHRLTSLSHNMKLCFIFLDLRQPYLNSPSAPKVSFQFEGFVGFGSCRSRSERPAGGTLSSSCVQSIYCTWHPLRLQGSSPLPYQYRVTCTQALCTQSMK